MAEDLCDELVHRKIIQIFGDYNNEENCPLSIHSMMKIAKDTFNKKPGDWFGPTTVSHILKKTLEKTSKNPHPYLEDLKIYVAKDSTIYKSDIYSMCKIKQEPLSKPCPSYDR